LQEWLAALKDGLYRLRSLRSGWDALKHAPTLGMVKTERQDVATDALPLVLLVF
jgi:hypothetical protein